MSVSTTIKKQLKAKIEALSTVQAVYGHEEPNPSGWPAVMITSSDLEGEFSSTAENSRLYSFSVLIIFPVGQDFRPEDSDGERLEYAEEVVADVVDQIINSVDNDFELDGVAEVLYVQATDGSWGSYTFEGGIAKAFNMTVRLYTEVTVV